MAQQLGQEIVGYDNVVVVGLAPHEDLQNIRGDNWAKSPLNRDHVTYCYLRDPHINAQAVAANLGATLRTEPVRIDNYR